MKEEISIRSPEIALFGSAGLGQDIEGTIEIPFEVHFFELRKLIAGFAIHVVAMIQSRYDLCCS